jgi:hypothetical protein
MTTRSIPQSLRWLGAPHQDDLDITTTQSGRATASGRVNRGLMDSLEGLEAFVYAGAFEKYARGFWTAGASRRVSRSKQVEIPASRRVALVLPEE